eukprot:835147-Alexandrium_andersonii.AAC.1
MRSVSSTAAVSICWASSTSGVGDGNVPGPAAEGATPSSGTAPPVLPPGNICGNAEGGQAEGTGKVAAVQ